MEKIKVVIVAGPTSSGKSDLALRLATWLRSGRIARQFAISGAEIISADSRQVYRGMDIGTGKVRKEKIRSKNVEYRSTDIRHSSLDNSYFSGGIRHWMLDVASPKRQYTVAQWKKATQKAILNIARRGKLPIVCGGTGFWIDALVYDLAIPDVKPDALLRARLAKLSPAQLFAKLKKLDPRRAQTIDRHNPRRLIRALEIVMATGKPIPKSMNGSPYEPLYLAIDVPRQRLAQRIARRLDARLRHGMLAEVRRLHAEGVSWKRLEDFGLEYRWIARHLRQKSEVKMKNLSAERADEEIRRNSALEIRTSPFQAIRKALLTDIIGYAKRQMTWFRRNKNITWIKNPGDVEKRVRKFLS